MTVEEYYEAVRGLGLRPTNAPTVFRAPDGQFYRVPRPVDMTSDQMAETIEQLKARMRDG